MTTYLVEHRWEPSSKRSVKRIMSRLIEKAASGEFASGFRLLNVVMNKDDSCAECIWESSSREDLERYLSGLKLPTVHSISEVQVLYGLEKVIKAA